MNSGNVLNYWTLYLWPDNNQCQTAIFRSDVWLCVQFGRLSLCNNKSHSMLGNIYLEIRQNNIFKLSQPILKNATYYQYVAHRIKMLFQERGCTLFIYVMHVKMLIIYSQWIIKRLGQKKRSNRLEMLQSKKNTWKW